MNKYGTPILDASIKEENFRLLQVGDTGTGKTARALTATKYGPVLFLDFDGKVKASARVIPVQLAGHVNMSNVLVKDMTKASLGDVNNLINDLNKDFISGAKPISTLVVDTFTNLNELAYNEVGGSKLDKTHGLTMQEYGIMKNKLAGLFKNIFLLPCNLIINCHDTVSEDDTGFKRIMIKGQGKFYETLAPKMTDTHYLEITTSGYKVRVKNSKYFGVNTLMDPSLIDSDGYCKVPHLDIFGGYAYKVLPEGVKSPTQDKPVADPN